MSGLWWLAEQHPHGDWRVKRVPLKPIRPGGGISSLVSGCCCFNHPFPYQSMPMPYLPNSKSLCGSRNFQLPHHVNRARTEGERRLRFGLFRPIREQNSLAALLPLCAPSLLQPLSLLSSGSVRPKSVFLPSKVLHPGHLTTVGCNSSIV